MNEVYVLTYGEYSDSRIVGVFSTRQLAEAEIVKDALDGRGPSTASIDTIQVDVVDQR